MAREMMPNAKLVLYGVPVSTLTESKAFLQRIEGYAKAGELGLIDEIDAVSFPLYVRWGLNDSALYDNVERYARIAMKYGQRLKKTGGTAVPLAPVLGFRFYDGWGGGIVSPKTIR